MGSIDNLYKHSMVHPIVADAYIEEKENLSKQILINEVPDTSVQAHMNFNPEPTPPGESNYLRFTSIDGDTLVFNVATPITTIEEDLHLEYSTDGEHFGPLPWYDYYSQSRCSLTIAPGETIYLRGNTDNLHNLQISASGMRSAGIDIAGSVQSLLDGVGGSGTAVNMKYLLSSGETGQGFNTMPDLTASVLTEGCYDNIIGGDIKSSDDGVNFNFAFGAQLPQAGYSSNKDLAIKMGAPVGFGYSCLRCFKTNYGTGSFGGKLMIDDQQIINSGQRVFKDCNGADITSYEIDIQTDDFTDFSAYIVTLEDGTQTIYRETPLNLEVPANEFAELVVSTQSHYSEDPIGSITVTDTSGVAGIDLMIANPEMRPTETANQYTLPVYYDTGATIYVPFAEHDNKNWIPVSMTINDEPALINPNQNQYEGNLIPNNSNVVLNYEQRDLVSLEIGVSDNYVVGNYHSKRYVNLSVLYGDGWSPKDISSSILKVPVGTILTPEIEDVAGGTVSIVTTNTSGQTTSIVTSHDDPVSVTIAADTKSLYVDYSQAIFEVTVNNAHPEMGTISGAGTYSYGTEIEVSATPNEGYKIKSITISKVNGSYGTYQYPVTFMVGSNIVIIPSWGLDKPEYTITVKNTDYSKGSAYANPGVVYEGESTTLEAYPQYGWLFKQWDDGNTDNPRTVENVTENMTFTAEFEAGVPISISIDPWDAGRVTALDRTDTIIRGAVREGDNLTMSATSDGEYQFVKWSDNDGTESTDNPRTVENLTSEFITTAIFEVHTRTYTVTAEPNEPDYGTVTGSGEYEEGAEVTITATPNEGYVFNGWSGYWNEQDHPTIQFNLYQDMAIIANFAPAAHTVTVSSNNDEYGTVSGGGPVADNGFTYIEANANEGYVFVEWNDGVTSQHSRLVNNITEDMSFTATFAPIAHYVTVSSNNDEYGYATVTNNSGTSGTSVGVNDNGAVTIDVNVSSGYYDFLQWSDGVTKSSRYITNITEDMSFTATFAPISHYVTVSSNNDEYGQCYVSNNSGMQSLDTIGVADGGTALIFASPNDGYAFSQWNDGNIERQRTISNVTADMTFTAEFEAADPGTLDNEG